MKTLERTPKGYKVTRHDGQKVSGYYETLTDAHEAYRIPDRKADETLKGKKDDSKGKGRVLRQVRKGKESGRALQK